MSRNINVCPSSVTMKLPSVSSMQQLSNGAKHSTVGQLSFLPVVTLGTPYDQQPGKALSLISLAFGPLAFGS